MTIVKRQKKKYMFHDTLITWNEICVPLSSELHTVCKFILLVLGYSHLKEEALDRTMRTARFGRGFGPVVRQTTKWMNEWIRLRLILTFTNASMLVRQPFQIWRLQVRASSYNSNKLTNQMQQFYKFITWRFVSHNMFRAPPRPSSGAYNCINSLWFYLGAWW
jgi:hypothetical protein